MRAGAVPSLTLVVLEVSDYALLVADMSRDRIKVYVPVHDPDLSIVLHVLSKSYSSSPVITLSSSIALAPLFG